MGTLYVGIDIFYPGRYRPQQKVADAETYELEEQFAYVVLQPVLVESAGNSLNLPAYFELDGNDLSRHDIRFIDSSTTTGPEPTPVPFSPHTSLQLELTWDDQLERKSIARIIPSRRFAGEAIDSDLLLRAEHWPEFAIANFARPPVADYELLWQTAQDEVLSWAVSLVPRILARARESAEAGAQPLTEAEKFACFQLVDLEKRIQAQPDTPPDEAWVRQYLGEVQDGSERVAAIWTRMSRPDAAEGPSAIMPPRFYHDQRSLRANPKLLFELKEGESEPVALSYHYKLWTSLQKQARESKVKNLKQGVGRLFGFGERLRWPRPVVDDAFMIVDQTATRFKVTDAIGTNAHSLLGQVFRVPVRIGSTAKPASLKVGVNGEWSADLAGPFAALLDEITHDLDGTYKVSLALDADRAAGFFVYAPKMAEATATGGPDGMAYYTLPDVLLDAADHTPRWSATASAETLLVRNAPRSGLRENELYRSEVLAPSGAARRLLRKVQIQPFPATGTARPLFKVSLGTDLNSSEASELSDRFKTLDAKGAALWVTLAKDAGGSVHAWPLEGNIVAVGEEPTHGAFAIIADVATGSDSLTTLLGKAARPQGPSAEAADAGVAVDLLFGETTIADPLFNLVVFTAAPSSRPLCILRGTFASRLSATTDRLMGRVELSFSPSPFPHGVGQSLLDHLGNFNKLRVALASDSPAVRRRTERPSGADPARSDGRVVTFLTYPDAAAPLGNEQYLPDGAPWLGAAPQGPKRHFGYFVSHIFTQDARADDDLSLEERNTAESLRYVNYLTPEIPWRIEGYAEHQYSYRLPFLGPRVSLPLASDIRNPANASKAASGREDVPLLRWSLQEDGTTLRLAFSREFIRVALDADGASTPRPTRLRLVYEPLADLLSALDRGSAVLRLERWNFQADVGLSSHAVAVEPSGGLVAHLRCVGRSEYVMRPQTPALAGLGVVRSLLDLPLTAFEAQLRALAADPSDEWFALEVPFDNAWTGDASSGPLAAQSDVLRLGLRLNRPDDTVATPDVLAQPVPGFGLPVDAALYPSLKDETFASLLTDATKELATYLSREQPGPLRTSFAWLRSASPQPTPSASRRISGDPEQVYDPDRVRKTFGELASTVLIPLGERPPLAEVIDVYYVPLAFRSIRAHAQFGDVRTTLEFAQFLVQLVDELCNGREPALVRIDTASPADAYAVGARLRTSLLPQLARQLAALLTYVHNDTPVVTDPLFARVDDLTKQLMNGPAVATVCEELLLKTPALYVTSKALGLGIFEPSTWTSRLFALQIDKRIRSKALSTAAPNNDREQVVFSRFRGEDRHFFVDLLDDARYDNEFEIDESRFTSARSRSRSALRTELVRRGATQARTGEDVIEQRHRFDDGSQAPRQLEADVVHWNPSWRTAPTPGQPEKRFYLLPSRRFPSAPIVLKPKSQATAGDDATPGWRGSLDLIVGEGDERPNLAGQLRARLARLLQDWREVRFPGGVEQDLVAGSIPAQAFASPENTRGWWHVESYASAHYFLIEPDEELDEDGSILPNDRFSIEVQLHARTPPAESDDPQIAPEPKDSVGLWFAYSKKVAQGNGATVPVPPHATLAGLASELESWLLPPAGGTACELLQPYESPSAAALAGAARTLTWFSLASPQLKEVESTPAPHSIGSVLVAEVLEVRRSSADEKRRYVLRVVVLDEPWRHTRVRVRVERNLRSVDGDTVPDINRAFQMIGAFSAWSTHGLETSAIDFSTSERVLPSRVRCLKPRAVTAEDYLALSATDVSPPAAADYGDILGAALDATFTDSEGRVQSFWNLAHARDAGARIGGLILQRRLDLHPRFGHSDAANQFESRTEVIARQHLSTLPADDSSRLFARIEKRHVPTLHQQAKVVWLNADGEQLFSCTWPIVFLRR